jgi:SAM-dependent methyltransferase
MPKFLSKMLPLPVRRMLIRAFESRVMRKLRFRGKEHYCPICRSHLSRFCDYGRITILKNEECPVCGSHRRHRMMWLYLDRNRSRLFGKERSRLLEIAPLRTFSERFASDPRIEYLSGDLKSPLAMVKMDLTKIEFPDESFDAIYCSHVLEHIPNDARAMEELARILRTGGWAILQVPLDRNRATTYEDATITDPEGRERAFGQFDHVRMYGRDYKMRLEKAGFVVTVDPFVETLSKEDVHRLGLDPLEDVYLCEKQIRTDQVKEKDEASRQQS